MSARAHCLSLMNFVYHIWPRRARERNAEFDFCKESGHPWNEKYLQSELHDRHCNTPLGTTPQHTMQYQQSVRPAWSDTSHHPQEHSAPTSTHSEAPRVHGDESSNSTRQRKLRAEARDSFFTWASTCNRNPN